MRNCMEFLGIKEGLELHHDGDLPARSGIGSSSSFTVGMLNVLHALKYEMVLKRDLADEAIAVEQEWIRESVGNQDQIIAAYGGPRVIEMGPGNTYAVRSLILPPDYLRALKKHVLLGFTGISRTASDHADSQILRIRDGQSDGFLSEIKEIAQETLGLLSKDESLEKLGGLLDRSWALKRQLSGRVSNGQVDGMYETAKKAGAFGGKLLGAGGGGFMMFLAPPYRHAAVRKALPGITVWAPFEIDDSGSQIILADDLERGQASSAAPVQEPMPAFPIASPPTRRH